MDGRKVKNVADRSREGTRRAFWAVVAQMGFWSVALIAVGLWYADKAFLGGHGFMGVFFWAVGIGCLIWAAWVQWSRIRAEASDAEENR